MKIFHKPVTVAAMAMATALSLSATVHATTLNFDLQFETSDQSIWDTGNAFSFNDDRFLGLEFNESVDESFTIPLIFDEIDVGIEASTSGRIGLQSTLNLDGGTVNAFIPVDLSVVIPDEPVNRGEPFTIQTGFSFGSGATFTTSSPRASYALDLIFELAAALDLEPVDFLDFSFDINESTNLVSFDSETLDFDLNGPLGSLSVSFPNVDTMGTVSGSNQLISSGEDTFLDGTLDLDFIATSLFGLPPLEGDESIDLGIFGDLGVNYNLLDVEATAALSILQQFSLISTLPALLLLEDGTSIPFNVGDNITLTFPDTVGKFLDIDALIDFNALFSNSTNLGLDLGLDLLAGQFGLEIPIIPDFSVTLFEDSVDIVDTSFEVYDRTFNLAGFNQQQVSFQVEAVPEPTSVMGLLTFGAFGVGFLLKRKQQQEARAKI